MARGGGGLSALPPEAPTPAFDVDAIRRDFPILAREVHGKPLVYLDSGASAQKPKVVIDRVVRAYGEDYANVHRGLHFLANASTEAFEEAREAVRRFLNAASTDEIVFTRSSTEGLNLLASSLGATLRPGDEIVLSIMEHHSNIVPWHFHRERNGAVLKWVPVGDDGAFSLDAFAATLTPRTKIVAITHMSNVLGTVVPIRDVCRIAHERGITVVVDGSQGAVHLPVDVRDLDCDFYVVTGHKLYGPTAIGAVYGKAAKLAALRPYQGGGEMIREVTTDTVTYLDPPHRFEAGTPPIAEAIGLGAAIAYMESVGRQRVAAHEAALRDHAHQRLAAIDGLTIYGTAPGKGAIVAFNLAGAHPHDVSMVLDREGIAIRAGTHCAQPLLRRFGVTATCRASFGMYNTTAEVDRLAEGLLKAKRLFS
ncbi:MAG: cysteine desulfurase [Bauldia sp.]|nr:cysteine desulfurase [Bauldia sp.]